MPLDINGTTTAVELPAQTTACPFLVIVPAIGVNNTGDGVVFRGSWNLLHSPTGRAVVGSRDPHGLEVLASALTDCGDWDFSDPAHFASPQNTAMVDKARKVIRDWQIDQGYTGPPTLLGDDEERKVARDREPATTLMYEELETWPKHFQSIYERKLIATNKDAWVEAISGSVARFGNVYLLAVLQRLSPEVADIATRQYLALCDAGDGMCEQITQWAQEIADGNPLTLLGIPDVDPLADWVSGPLARSGQS